MRTWILYAVIVLNLAFIFFGSRLGITSRAVNFISMGLLAVSFIVYMFIKREN